MGEMGVLESDKRGRGPGRASHRDLERSLQKTGMLHKDENKSVANTGQRQADIQKRVPITNTARRRTRTEMHEVNSESA